MPITNLVFQGGGVKAAAYAGAVRELARRGHFDSVRSVAGTSAGSMTASVLAVGADPDQLEASVRGTHFSKFLDGRFGLLGNLYRLLARHGFHPADTFSQIMRTQYQQICGDGEITFGELERRREAEPDRYRQLFVISSDVAHQTPVVFSASTHPDLPIWRAVRMSVSIPIVFEPVHHAGGVFVDGGLTWNYPIDLYDHPDPAQARPGAGLPRSRDTLGFCLGDRNENRASRQDWRSPRQHTRFLFQFLEAMGLFLMNTANRAHVSQGDLDRTVFIDDEGIAATDFDAPASTIDSLIESGRQHTATFFEEVWSKRAVEV